MLFLRAPAMGESVQIGQYYDYNTKQIIWAFPRFANGSSALEDESELQVLGYCDMARKKK